MVLIRIDKESIAPRLEYYRRAMITKVVLNIQAAEQTKIDCVVLGSNNKGHKDGVLRRLSVLDVVERMK